MEQHRTGPPRPQQRSQTPLLPSSGPGEAAAVCRVATRPARPVPPVVLALRRLPNPRLTGLGSGLFAAAVMLVFGGLDGLLFDGSAVVYGLLFLPVSALTALWVRPVDLVTAPIAVPIAFAVGMVPIAGGGGEGLGSRIMAVITGLAVHAGWLYGGTLVAGVITTVRKVRLMTQRRQQAAALRTAARRPKPVKSK
ncbi:DUF6542 domain-containing protein [Streptomyces spiramyceticus]|uniref:DUF6542 domain-containing protein n=1 Tax=Streptomyces spiramyceticus TaxID=299717 RepID=UPI00237A9D49|nr:DUF6542 domain-containing protein [Streptomyces spiramyceticus]